MCLCRLGRRQCLPEGIVFRFIHGAVDVGGLALPIARGAVRHIHINAGEADKRCRCIIEVQPIIAKQATYRLRKLPIGQWSGGDDEDAVIRGGQLRDLLVMHMDQWMLHNALRHIGAERLAIHRQCAAGRNSRMICRLHDDGVHAAHLLFEHADGIHQPRRPQGVAADEFRKGIRLMCRRTAQRTHLKKLHGNSCFSRLPCCLGTSKPGPDDAYAAHERVPLRALVFRFVAGPFAAASVSFVFSRASCARFFWRASSFSMGLPIREGHAPLLQ